MKVQELRIGNIVSTPNQPLFRIDLFDYVVNGIGKFGQIADPLLHPLTWYLQDLKPVKLTKQLVYEFGFKNGNDDATALIKNGFEVIELNDGTFEFLNHNFPIKLEYVHKPQNIYYSLMDDELILDCLINKY